MDVKEIVNIKNKLTSGLIYFLRLYFGEMIFSQNFPKYFIKLKMSKSQKYQAHQDELLNKKEKYEFLHGKKYESENIETENFLKFNEHYIAGPKKQIINYLNNAACDGKLDIVKRLYQARYECTKYGYNRALRNNHLEVVKFLNENCKDNYFSKYDIEGTLIHSKNEEIKEYIRNYIMKKNCI